MYGHVITKFSGMGRFTYPWCSVGALCAPELRYYQTISNLMHDVHNNMVPSGILNLFQTSNCHYYNTRASASGNFYVNSSDLELYKLSFSCFGATLWNEIPCNIRHLPKNKKKTLRKLLFDILNSEDEYIDTPTLIQKVKLAKNVEK